MTRMRQLDLRFNPISARGIEALAASPYLKALWVLNLDGNSVDPVDRHENCDDTNFHCVPTEPNKTFEAKFGTPGWLPRS